MKPVIPIVVIILAAAVPAALSMQCYVCSSDSGNCKTNPMDCQSGWCTKTTKGDAVAKLCTSNSGCDALTSACKTTGECKNFCCDSDKCNGGASIKPAAVLIGFVVVCFMALGRYLM